MSKKHLFISILIITLLTFQPLLPVFAQGTGYLEDEGDWLWEQSEYKDSTGREFETSDSQYVGEQQIKEAEEAARRAGRPSVNLAAALEKDKEMLPDNIIYGIGTGSVIGGWLALVQGKSARDNVRFVSVGIIVGTLLGMLVGTKSLYVEPAVPISRLNRDQQRKQTEEPLFQIGFKAQNSIPAPQLKLQYKF